MILSVTSLSHADMGPVAFSLGIGAAQFAGPESKPLAQWDTKLEYKFAKVWSLGATASYLRQMKETNSDIARGLEDPSIFLMNNKLYRDRRNDITVQGKLAYIAPVADYSKEITMQGAALQSLITKKGFGHGLTATYTLTFTEYSYQKRRILDDDKVQELSPIERDYILTHPDADGPSDVVFWNTPFRMTNILALEYEVQSDFHLQGGFATRTYYDFSGRTYNLYSTIAGLVFDLTKQASIRLQVFSTCMDPSMIQPVYGPTAAETPFGAEGIMYSFGLVVAI